jgi:hypothetical protein
MNDRTGWEPIGPARLNRTLKAQHLDAHNARQLARIARETGNHLPRITGGAMAGGDARAMRGVPVQARGVGGTVRGTDPLATLIAKQPHE